MDFKFEKINNTTFKMHYSVWVELVKGIGGFEAGEYDKETKTIVITNRTEEFKAITDYLHGVRPALCYGQATSGKQALRMAFDAVSTYAMTVDRNLTTRKEIAESPITNEALNRLVAMAKA